MSQDERSRELRALMEERILVLDGAMGTMLQSKELGADDFGGAELEGCNEILVETRPDVILDVHRAYLRAGADIIETDTFGGTPLVLAEYGLAARAEELNRRAAELARQAADEESTARRPRFVAGSMGPTTKAISVTGGVSFEELVESFRCQAAGLLAGGVDLLLVETCQDTRNTKAALIALETLFAAQQRRWPMVVSGTIEPTGTMLAGQSAEAFVASLQHLDLLAMGLNCATGPAFMTDHLRAMHHMLACGLSCYPNAGLPDEDGRYQETPASLAAALERFVDRGWLNLVGGCCGTTDQHIAAIAAMVGGRPPRRLPAGRRSRVFFSGVELVEATDDNRPLLVGERSNVIGSSRFKRLITEENWDEAAEVARRQVKNGAQIVDVCLQTTERDEIADIRSFYERLIRTVKAPIMIDTTDPEAVAVALSYCQGRSIVNSVNLEDGEDRLRAVCPLLRRFGAAVVVGTIDEDPEQAQAFTRERKLAVATRAHQLLTTTYGLDDEDLIFDPLVFPVASGDEAYVGAAVETIAGLELIKAAIPRARTILGVSNVSFGLPGAAREVVNSVFLYHATRAGLDLAIVNTEKIERFATLDAAERELAENLLFNRPPQDGELATAPVDWRQQNPAQRLAINRLHVERIATHFRGVKKKEPRPRLELPLDERLANHIIEGSRDGLVDDLDEKLARGIAPLDIVNGPLMAGMAEVGRLFNTNQLIVAEVLLSAEAMKAAVTHLEQFMEAGESSDRGSVVLATVKGDVHDIGKNLVEIIFANNGFRVINLGIKVPPERLIAAVREHRPDAVGLSGLLVKSAQQMVVTAQDMAAAGLETPILVGGAALSGKFTRQRIAPEYPAGVLYCADAMAGLATMTRLMDPDQRQLLLAEHAGKQVEVAAPAARPRADRAVRGRGLAAGSEPLPLPYAERRVLDPVPDLDEVWRYLNPQMLFAKHLGYRASFCAALAAGEPRARQLQATVEEIKAELRGWMRVRAVWRFFAAEADAETLRLFAPGSDECLFEFSFPRQSGRSSLSLADYVAPPRNGLHDSVALFVVTAGEGVRQRAEAAKEAGEFLKSHVMQAIALETAEAAAEWLHATLRSHWGFPDPTDMLMGDLLAARYRGKRYSPGYPACPDLDDQRGIFRLLAPQDIGVELTESMMMDPEASVSAIVFHHPQARYFSVE